MKKILWLASWYPNKISPLNGDFIQRHAEAVAIYEHVHVIFVVKDEYGVMTDHVTIENSTRGNLSESIAYYKPFITGIKFFDRIISVFIYLKIFRELITSFIKNNGTPNLVHVHVAMWVGIVALWLKRENGIPYIVTEHWTGYDKNAIENIYNKGKFFKYLSGVILKHAGLIVPVSQHLGKYIQDNISPVKFKVVSNVVNTLYFTLSDYSGKEFKFIHVSSMSHQKNIEGLLNSFSQLLLSYTNWKLTMAGPASVDLKNKASQLGLDNCIEWTGKITYAQVAKKMSESSALVMFSRYENQPCVILEALCCGLPVIATDIGGIPEVITAHNGILVTSENELQLLQAMIEMIENYKAYDKIQISKMAKEKYNYETIGKIIADLYNLYRPK